MSWKAPLLTIVAGLGMYVGGGVLGMPWGPCGPSHMIALPLLLGGVGLVVIGVIWLVVAGALAIVRQIKGETQGMGDEL